MTAKKALLTFVATLVAVYLAIFAFYISHPLAFHFRAWEFFDIFVYSGVYGRHQRVVESGDSARGFFIQRYTASNEVSVNEFGNRLACYDPSPAKKPRLLLLGDSQLFGSGTDDTMTFPAQLCRLFHANVYDGSRINGMSLLRVDSLQFDTILFTTTERFSFVGKFCERLDQYAADYDRKISESDIRVPQLNSGSRSLKALGAEKAGWLAMLGSAREYLNGYLAARLDLIFKAVLNSPVAPPGHLIKQHRYQPVEPVLDENVECAKSLAAFFEPKGIAVGFLVFPAHQTIYGRENGIAVDDGTLNFIDRLSERLAAAGLRTMNTKTCLNEAKLRNIVFQMHDSHLNADGYRSIVECLRGSDLAGLGLPRTHQ